MTARVQRLQVELRKLVAQWKRRATVRVVRGGKVIGGVQRCIEDVEALLRKGER